MAASVQPTVSTDTGDDERSELSRDDIHHVLRNRRRRFALHHLKHRDDAVDVGELATQVAAWENGVDHEAVTSKQRRRVYNALQQTHIPELDDTGLVDVDRRELVLTDRAKNLDIYTEVIRGNDFPWSQYYLSLSLVTAGLMAAVWVNVYPLTLLPSFAWGIFCVTAFLVSSIVHVVVNRNMKIGGAAEPPELRDGERP